MGLRLRRRQPDEERGSRKYLDETKAAPVDLLFVSHLHRDHVSGLPELLSRVKVHLAFLPHTSRAERLLLTLRCLSEAPTELWVAKFLYDPAGWLRTNGVDQVIEVVRGRGPAPDPRRSERNDDDPAPHLRVFERGATISPGTRKVTDEAQIVLEYVCSLALKLPPVCPGPAKLGAGRRLPKCSCHALSLI